MSGEPSSLAGASYVFRRRLTVEWGHCDPAGIVFHPRYFEFFDWNCVLLIEAALGLRERAWRAELGYGGIPVVDLSGRFTAQVRHGDEVEVASGVTRLGRSSLELRHELRGPSGLAVQAAQTRVWCATAPDGRLVSAPMPERLRRALSPG
ncbi:thioesterase family protein [Oceanicella sp. SM1341]|uniref:acyl-CoA thioesterase n=1 Tax=Oceanicella sp. SM1341 TaxID=1548889 RepID=UPI000E48720F|nr:thioesterase family protein [Oceanicella sp. SM1341]